MVKEDETAAIVNAVRAAVPRAWPLGTLDDARLEDLSHVRGLAPSS